MSRRHILAVSMLAVGTLVVTAVADLPTRLIWNATASAPIGFYTVAPADALEIPELVAIMPPEPPPIRRIKNPIRIQINANGRIYTKINSSIAEPELSSVPVYSTPASFSIGSKFESGRYGV